MLNFFKKKKKKTSNVNEENNDNNLTNQESTNNTTDTENQQTTSSTAKQTKQSDDDQQVSQDDMMSAAMAGMMGGGDITEMLKNIDTSGMSMKEKMALKMLQKMPREKQEEVLRQALNPQELYKHKDQVLAQIDAMVAAGQIDKSQAEAVKAQMGLR